MLKHDFLPEFDRLCRGLRYEPTNLQAEAWFERVGRTAPAVWKKAVTVLLCRKHFPTLDDALDAIEQEAEQSRKNAVMQDKVEAERMMAHLQQEIQKEEDPSRIPTPATSLFHCIEMFARRDQVRAQLGWVERQQGWPKAKITRELSRLLTLEAQLTQEVVQLSEVIHHDDLRKLLKKYEPLSAAVAS